MSRQPKYEQFLIDLKANLEGRVSFCEEQRTLHNDRAVLAKSRGSIKLSEMDYRSAADEAGRIYAYQTIIKMIDEAMAEKQEGSDG